MVAVLPDVLQQLLAAEDLAGGRGQEQQQFHLGRGQREVGAALGDDESGPVDGQFAVGLHGGRARLGGAGVPVGGQRGAPQHRADAGLQHFAARGLDDVVVGARLQAEDHVEVVAAGGEHDDRQLAVGADAPADLEAVLAREHQVQQHDVGAEGGQEVQAVLAAGRGRHLVAAPAEREGDSVAHGGVVLDQKYSGHGTSINKFHDGSVTGGS